MPPQITTHLAWPRCKIKGPQGLLCKIRPLQGYGIGWNGSYEDTPTRCRCIVQLHACCPCWPTCSIARHAHRRCCKSFAVHLHRSKGVPYRPKRDKPPDPEVWGARDTQIEAGGGSPPFLGCFNLRPDRFGGPLSGRPFCEGEGLAVARHQLAHQPSTCRTSRDVLQRPIPISAFPKGPAEGATNWP